MVAHKVAVTLPEELYDLVERARSIEHRSRSEIIQEALRTHFGESIHVPSDTERRALVEALDEVDQHPGAQREWDDVRRELWPNE